MDWFLERLQQFDPKLDYQDFCNHNADFKKLVDLNIIKYSEVIELLPCEWCDVVHDVSLFCNKSNEIILSCCGNRRVVESEELKIWTINKDVLCDNIKSNCIEVITK